MRLENTDGVKSWTDINHNDHKKTSGRMPYITVTENAVKWWITVQGLNHHEVRSIESVLTLLLTYEGSSSDGEGVRSARDS